MSYRNIYVIVILSLVSALLAEPQIIIIKKIAMKSLLAYIDTLINYVVLVLLYF